MAPLGSPEAVSELVGDTLRAILEWLGYKKEWLGYKNRFQSFQSYAHCELRKVWKIGLAPRGSPEAVLGLIGDTLRAVLDFVTNRLNRNICSFPSTCNLTSIALCFKFHFQCGYFDSQDFGKSPIFRTQKTSHRILGEVKQSGNDGSGY